MDATEVVVGTDGSPSGTAAVRWAIREARHRGAPVRAIMVYDWGWQSGRFGGTEELRRMAEAKADTVLADAILASADLADGVTVHREAVPGAPVPVLLEAAEKAALLVVGNRGHGGFGSLLLGSVGQRVATRATCPVAVIRGRQDATDGAVVVGTDGSAAADTAVELAFTMAAERQTELVAIRAYVPPVPTTWGLDVPPPEYDPHELETAERDALTASLAPWRDKYPNVKVEALVARGPAARVLVGVSHTAQLVVAGSRGHSGLTGTVIGSTGLQLLHHADSPVLITRTPRTRPTRPGVTGR